MPRSMPLIIQPPSTSSDGRTRPAAGRSELPSPLVNPPALGCGHGPRITRVPGSAPSPLRRQAAAAVALPQKLPSYIADHRKRLRERFMRGGADAVPDYELLELVLFGALPRQDVKPLARLLIETFGDFNGVVSASPERLLETPGVGDNVVRSLKVIEAAAHRLSRARVLGRQVISSWDALIDYCHTVMSHRETEHFRVLFLDRKNTLIADEEQARGTVDHVPVYPREVVKRALELERLGADPGPQPPLRRPDSLAGRHRDDGADQGGGRGAWHHAPRPYRDRQVAGAVLPGDRPALRPSVPRQAKPGRGHGRRQVARPRRRRPEGRAAG